MPAMVQGRRAFLEAAALGGAALLVCGFRRAAAEPSRRELRLALLSDTHVPGDRRSGHRGMNPWEHVRVAAAQVAAARPDGVVISGDVARLEGREEDYRELRALLEPVSAVAPVYIAPGNHDDRSNLRKVFPDRPGRLASPVEGRLVTVVEHEALRVVVLDSLLYVNQVAGLLGRAQREWLAGFLPQAADRPVVLFVHHPPTDEDGDLLDGDRLLRLVEAHPHVKALFHGHAHVWSVGRRGRLPVVGLPSLGYSFDDAQPVGWVDARFRPDGVSLTLRAVAGNRAGDGKETFLPWPA